MDIPLYPIIVTVVEECHIVFKKTIVENLNEKFIFAYPKIGIGFLLWLLVFILHLSSHMKKKINNLDKLLITYNSILGFCHLYIFFRCVNLWIRVISWVCEYEDVFSVRISSVQESTVNVTNEMYIFSFIKFLELLNIICRVLLKKSRSNLLVMYYHHVMLILTCWMCSKYYLESYIALLLMSSNSVVHGVKYVYYGTSVLFQLSGMWTQHVFRQILKLLALGQYVVLSLYVGYLLIVDDSVADVMRTLILVNSMTIVFILVKY